MLTKFCLRMDVKADSNADYTCSCVGNWGGRNCLSHALCSPSKKGLFTTSTLFLLVRNVLDHLLGSSRQRALIFLYARKANQ